MAEGGEGKCPHFAMLHYTTLYYTTLYYTTLYYTALHYTTLHHTTPHYITLHYTTLHHITLHYTTLHHTTLHYRYDGLLGSLSLGKEQMSAVGFGFGDAGIVLGDIEGIEGIEDTGGYREI